MHSALIAEWILSLVLPRDRAASTIGDWMEDAAERGPIWFWSSVFRTVLANVWSDFTERPGFMVGLAMWGWIYSFGLMASTYFGLLLSGVILTPLIILATYLARQLHWHLSSPAYSTQLLGTVLATIWLGWCKFQTGRWIARRAPGRELTAGIVACLAPTVFLFVLGTLAEYFRGPEINRYVASHPGQSGNLPSLLPSEIFLLAGIFWSRHKSFRSVAQ